MPKSYKITHAETFNVRFGLDRTVNLTKQMYIQGVVPGPETKMRSIGILEASLEFEALSIDHEYQIRMQGRLYENGTAFGQFIAKGQIAAYLQQGGKLFLLSGRKREVLDFCRRTADIPEIELRTIEVDMSRLQERLPEINGVWFHCKKGYIRAKAFMGSQIQNTADFKKARSEGDISSLSFYFEDPRNGTLHPIMVTEDGTVVLQGNYPAVEDEVGFVLEVKRALLDGLYAERVPGKARHSLASQFATD